MQSNAAPRERTLAEAVTPLTVRPRNARPPVVPLEVAARQYNLTPPVTDDVPPGDPHPAAARAAGDDASSGRSSVDLPPLQLPVYEHRPTTPPDTHSKSPSAASSGSGSTVFRLDLNDPMGGRHNVVLKKKAQDSLLQSVSAESAPLLNEALQQIKGSTTASVSWGPSGNEPGQAYDPVQVRGRQLAAFVSFGGDGRVTGVDLSDPATLEPVVEAKVGKTEPVLVFAAKAGSSSAPVSTAHIPLLQADPKYKARVDVSDQVMRSVEDAAVRLYQYEVPGAKHGLRVLVDKAESMSIDLIMADPKLRDTHGSGIDMALGMAKALNADGVKVSSIVASWVNKEGIDSQHEAYSKALKENKSEKEAALGTFSGKVAQMFGFTDISVTKDKNDDFVVRFSRPEQGDRKA